jgi:hypothetical protein
MVLYFKCKKKKKGTAMFTLKFAMIAMMAGSSVLPMHTENMQVPTANPKARIEIVNEVIVPAAPINEEEPVTINRDKTYEQCMREAFEKVYEEVNRMLDQIPEQCEEQFQLQRVM